MASYWVGTSGYTYKEWRGSFYPEDLAENEMLRFYAGQLPTVELNHTFYRPTTVRQLHAWAKETPDGFAFSFKAPRRITYDMRLRDTADLVSDFFETAGSLKGKLGAVLFQIPPFLKRDVPRLEDFLHQMPPGPRVAFDFRNQSWLNDEVYECLRRFGVALCAVEGAERDVPPEPTAGFGYFRLRRPVYGEDDLAATARRIQSAAGGWDDVYVYFKHEAEGAGPSYAMKLRSLLEGGAATAAAGL
jgi:uncharacterized protein YecE (DUF72 family)